MFFNNSQKNIKSVILLTTLACLLNSSLTAAQQCKTSSIAASNDPQQFVINSQIGTVIDARTGLEWSICSLGQTWQSGNCIGIPTHYANYTTALTSVTTYTDNNIQWQDYRLPNIKELGSIIEHSCNAPAIDLNAFTGTLNAVYYSSTSDTQGNLHFSPMLGVKAIDFTNGSEFIPDVNKFRYVRLVRTIN
ncbi:MAG: DUF1566 domain-containing protein [Colwellia sp.]